MEKLTFQNMQPIKKIAGRILLYFYSIQRTNYSSLYDLVLTFQMRHFKSSERSPVLTNKDQEIPKNLLKITDNDNNIYNSLIYLYEKQLINISKNPSNVFNNFLNLSVSSAGIDIIEGIEREKEERNNFYITFNIKLADNVNVESLMKTEIGSLVKASLV